MNIKKELFLVAFLAVLLQLSTGCKQDELSPSKGGPAVQGDGTVLDGFETAEAALDAYSRSLDDGDFQVFCRSVLTDSNEYRDAFFRCNPYGYRALVEALENQFGNSGPLGRPPPPDPDVYTRNPVLYSGLKATWKDGDAKFEFENTATGWKVVFNAPTENYTSQLEELKELEQYQQTMKEIAIQVKSGKYETVDEAIKDLTNAVTRH